MNAVLEQISKIGIVPVVKIDNAADALPLAKALCAGGLPCAEVTFRTAAAAEAIKFVEDDQLKYQLFIQHLNRVTSENGLVARTTKAIQEAKETLILFPSEES